MFDQLVKVAPERSNLIRVSRLMSRRLVPLLPSMAGVFEMSVPLNCTPEKVAVAVVRKGLVKSIRLIVGEKVCPMKLVDAMTVSVAMACSPLRNLAMELPSGHTEVMP